ncbi:MAG: Crp/Fnr family transcriptional regulator [Clostridiales bacterium]
MSEIKITEMNKLFASLSESDFEKFLQCANPVIKEFARGEIVMDQGDEQDSLILLLQGALELYKADSEGNRSLVSSLMVGETFGEQTIFGNNNINGFTVIAPKAAKVMFIDKSIFYRPCSKVCPTHQILIQNMLSLLANQANLLEKKITYLTAKSLRKKICLYLLEEYYKNNGVQSFTLNREEMADYFDVQRPSLSRELIAMKSHGIIDFTRNTFKILDLEKLTENTN